MRPLSLLPTITLRAAIVVLFCAACGPAASTEPTASTQPTASTEPAAPEPARAEPPALAEPVVSDGPPFGFHAGSEPEGVAEIEAAVREVVRLADLVQDRCLSEEVGPWPFEGTSIEAWPGVRVAEGWCAETPTSDWITHVFPSHRVNYLPHENEDAWVDGRLPVTTSVLPGDRSCGGVYSPGSFDPDCAMYSIADRDAGWVQIQVRRGSAQSHVELHVNARRRVRE